MSPHKIVRTLLRKTFVEPNLSLEPPDGALRVRFDQQTQPRFDRSFLRTSPTRPHGLTHQAVADLNICSHPAPKGRHPN